MKFEVRGLFDFDDMINAMALPNDVMNDMLHAAADVVVKAQKRTAEKMLSGKYATGKLVESIGKSRIKTNVKDGKYIRIIFKGSRTRRGLTTRNGEIAFINEYGKHGQAPRQFIRIANEECEEEALDAAGKVFDKFLSQFD